MSDARQLRDEFAAAFEAGDDPNPRDFVARAPQEERQEVAGLIDTYLMAAPRRAWDPEAYESSMSKMAVDQVFESVQGVSGTWPELLPTLRNRARVKRRELVERLAEALSIGGDERRVEKVGRYYHEMEHGLLPGSGVSQRVIDALAGIVGADAETIRRAGLFGSGGELTEDAVFARVADLDVAYASPPAEMASPGEVERAEHDEIDELFTGG